MYLSFVLFPQQSFCQQNESVSDEELVFVVLAHVREPSQDALWRQSCNSIQKFYPDTPIVVIDDHSNYPINIDGYNNVTIVQSEYAGAGELLPYCYFLEHRWAKKMVFLHDSMYLARAFTSEELSNQVKFHWHFISYQWDNSQQIRDLLKYLDSSNDLLNYYNNSRQSFYGCFGVTSIIDLSPLEYLEEKYRWVEVLKNVVNNREQRMGLERIFALLCFKEGLVQKDNCSNFGDIHHDYMWSKAPFTGAIHKTLHGR